MSSHERRLAHLPGQTLLDAAVATARMTLRQRLSEMLQARRSRQALREMSDHLLADIGVARGDAFMEASRRMWDIRPTRR